MATIRPLCRILAVDDDRFMRAAIEHALALRGGYVVEVCASGEEALDRAPAFAPDLLLLDVVMPGLDGPQTLEALRATATTAAATPAAFLRAGTDPARTRALQALGAIATYHARVDDVEGIDRWARQESDPHPRSWVLIGAAWGLIDLFTLPPLPDGQP